QGVERILHMIQIANDDDTQKPTSLKAISDFIADDNFNALEIDEAAGTNAAKQLSAKTIGQLNFRTVLPVE
ncbi:MAG: hypothetical protein K0S11_1415, partial [Gammaproteobacteria bacterium]|nr:hypothetical protein [Gammaproteobacteria bacterium]